MTCIVTVRSDCSLYDAFGTEFKEIDFLTRELAFRIFVFFFKGNALENVRSSDHKYERLLENSKEKCQLFMAKSVEQLVLFPKVLPLFGL